MIIVKDERTENTTSKCEQCGEIGLGRTVEVAGLFGESRGHWFLCFKCFGPRIWWKKSEGGKVFQSPASD